MIVHASLKVMQRIAIDMDEVMADALSEYLARYNSDFGLSFTQQDLVGKRLFDLAPPDHWPKLETYFDDENFFRSLAVIEGSQEVILALTQRYDVYVVTAAM